MTKEEQRRLEAARKRQKALVLKLGVILVAAVAIGTWVFVLQN